MIDYNELNRRLTLIKGLYQQYNIEINTGQGLADILLEVENILKGVNIPEDDERRIRVASFFTTYLLAPVRQIG